MPGSFRPQCEAPWCTASQHRDGLCIDHARMRDRILGISSTARPAAVDDESPHPGSAAGVGDTQRGKK